MGDQYKTKIASIKSIKAKRDLDDVHKYYEQQKSHKGHELSIQEKQLKKSLERLERLKHENKRRGSCLAPEDYTQDSDAIASGSFHQASNETKSKASLHASPKSKHSVHGDSHLKQSGHNLKSKSSHGGKCKERKGLIVKLQPGKIDPECMSPPNAHDVAVRMLFDKKAGQNGGKRKKKKSDHFLDVDIAGKSKSHNEAALRLPQIKKKVRRKSVANDEHQNEAKAGSSSRIHSAKRSDTPGSSSSSLKKNSSNQLANHKKHIYEVMKMCMNPDVVILSPEEQQALEKNNPGSSNSKHVHIAELRQMMKTPTPDKWHASPPLVPSKAWEQSENFESELFAEIERVARANKAKLPEIVNAPGSRTNLVEGTAQKNKGSKKKSHSNLGVPQTPPSQRRASMDYNNMEFLERKHSIAPESFKRRVSLAAESGRRASIIDGSGRRASIIDGRRGSLAQDSSHDQGLFSKSRRNSNVTDSKHASLAQFDTSLLADLDKKVDSDVIEHYYEVLALNKHLLQKADPSFVIPDSQKHIPLCTLKRSQRRKTLALETLLKSLPSYKHVADMDPKVMLDCRYLRLTKNNIEELEDACRYDGVDPGIHAHLTQDQVEEFFDQLDNNLDRSESISEIELAG